MSLERQRPSISLLALADFAGVAVFAVSGVLAGMHAGFDLFGLVVLAAVTAVGGGTIRDLLVRRSVFWVHDPRHLVVVLITTMAVIAAERANAMPGEALRIADALGLAFVAISGAQVSVRRHLPVLTTIVLGTLTGCGGGILRDLLTAHTPLVLRAEVYAVAAITGIAVYLWLLRSRVSETGAAAVAMTSVAAIRLAAIRWGWSLPHW